RRRCDRGLLLVAVEQLQLRATAARRRGTRRGIPCHRPRRNRSRPARAERDLTQLLGRRTAPGTQTHNPQNTHERRIEVNGYRDLRVALLGSGSVGAQVARLILEHNDELAARIGARLTLTGIAVRDL